MLDLIIFIKSDGARARPDFLKRTICSFENTVGHINYKYYFVLNRSQNQAVLDMVKNGILEGNKILKIVTSTASWARDFNLFFSSCKNLTKYILTSHDDLEIRTKDFFNTTMNIIKGKEKDVGWITFTCDTYYREFGRPWGVSARSGFHKDRFEWPYIFECHNFNISHRFKIKENEHLFDMPTSDKIVKIHAPYSVLNLVSVESMKKIGPCEDWTKYTMLIDEDWGLEALKNNLWNVWIPNIYYTHPFKEHRNLWVKEAHAKFKKKWGFGCHQYKDNIIKGIVKQYKDTLIPWSSSCNTYDWEYLE